YEPKFDPVGGGRRQQLASDPAEKIVLFCRSHRLSGTHVLAFQLLRDGRSVDAGRRLCPAILFALTSEIRDLPQNVRHTRPTPHQNHMNHTFPTGSRKSGAVVSTGSLPPRKVCRYPAPGGLLPRSAVRITPPGSFPPTPGRGPPHGTATDLPPHRTPITTAPPDGP